MNGAMGDDGAMDLTFQAWKKDEPINKNTLQKLQDAINTWRPTIERLVEQFAQRGVAYLLNRVRINGQRLPSYFQEFSGFVTVVVDLIREFPGDANGLLEDLIGILCLVGVTYRDFTNWFSAYYAEVRWQQLVISSNLLVQEAQGTYARHEKTFQRLFDAICVLLPPNSAFFIKLSATLIAQIWPQRRSIANWIAANWSTLVVVLILAALTSWTAYRLYQYLTATPTPSLTPTPNDGKKSRRKAKTN